MKEYIKSQIKNIPMTLVMFILFYGITTLATNYLFNSNEVSYDNTISGIKQDNVQGAIDELYACTSNYAAYNTRLTNTENKIGTGSLTTTSNTLIGGVNELIDNITSLLVVSAFNCVPGSTSQGDFTKDITKAGYTPIGIVGMQAIASYDPIANLTNRYISGNTLHYRTQAPSTSSGIKFYILYKKTL